MLVRRVLRFARAAGGLVVAAVVIATAAIASPGASERHQGGRQFRVGVLPAPSTRSTPRSWRSGRPSFCPRLLEPDEHTEQATSRGTPIRAGARHGLPGRLQERKDVHVHDQEGRALLERTPVLARDVVHSIERVLDPVMDSTWPPTLADLVGAQAILDGTTTRLSGATARAGR